MLSVGIIGLPNVGKSTLFNSLTAASAEVSNYPFTTIEANTGMVPVPDRRLERLKAVLQPEEAVPSLIRFIDIAGLVRGASRGEGLGNQFLGNIREVDAIVHVVRCFRDDKVAHVLGTVEPDRDIDIIETELLLADLELIDKMVEKKRKLWQTSPRQHAGEEKRLSTFKEALAKGTPLRDLGLSNQESRSLKGLGLLTGKPVLYVANTSEISGENEQAALNRIRQHRVGRARDVVAVSAGLESELMQLKEEERQEFMAELGIEESGLARLVRKAFELLNLITFYTTAHKKLRAWQIEQGTLAPAAAGQIHTDMEKGFIRAQVVSCRDLIEEKSGQELHRMGKVRTEGKTYAVKDGDVIEFLFSG